MNFNTRGYRKGKTAAVAMLVFCILSACLFAQSDKIRFKHLSGVDGLSQEVVSCIIQDKKGFMWFATQDGLNRYDGLKFKIYKNDPKDESAISDKRILCIYEDHEGILWIGTKDGGLNRFYREKDSFKNFKDYPKAALILGDYDVQTICEGPNGVLWIGTYGGGLLRLDKKGSTPEFKGYTTQDGLLSDNNINVIINGQNNVLWIGTQKGLDSFDQNTGEFSHYEIEASPKKSSRNEVTAICEVLGQFWIGTRSGGLYTFSTKKGFSLQNQNKPTDSMENPIRCLYKDRNEMLWVGTQKKLIQINPQNGDSIEFENNNLDSYSLNNNEVLSIWQDQSGIIWFGTYGGGLNIYDPGFQVFKLYTKEKNKLSHNIIWSILVDMKKRLWIGTYNGGLNLLDRKTGKITPFLEKEDVRCIHEDKNTGLLWIGTHGNGLIKFDPETGALEKITKGLSDGKVICIYQQPNSDEMWLGTYDRGLNHYNLKTGVFKAYNYKNDDPESISNDRVRVILKDKDGILWIGTEGGGLNRFIPETGKFKRYLPEKKNPNGLSHNRVRSIYQDRLNRIWIGTEGGGLNLLVDKDKGYFKSYGLLNTYVPNDTIYGILEDNADNLWMSTNSGLFKVSITKDKKNAEEISIKNYDFQDGLQSNEFNTGAFFKNKETEEMFFGGPKGFNSFFPKEITEDQNKPPIIFTDFLLNNIPQKIHSKDEKSPLEKVIDETKSLTLTYNQSMITLEFAALTYANPNKNKYKYQLVDYDYQLVDYDKIWLETDAKNNRATYTNLSAGEYIFKVKGFNKDGVWSEKEASIKLIILPPPWKTWWAYLLYFLVLATIVFRFVRAKKTLAKKVKERTKFLENIDNIVKSINAEMRFKDLLQKILKETLVIKGVKKASALVWDPEFKRYFFKATVGYDLNELKQIDFSEEEAEARYIEGTEKIDQDIFIVRDASKQPHFDKIADTIRSKSMLTMRICFENKPQAYFVFGNRDQKNAFFDQDIKLLQKLKDHIVEAFKKTQLIQQLQEKNNELKEISDQLIQAEKLSSMGTLLAGIAHELSNPAGTILMNAEWFSKAWKDISSFLDQYDANKKLVIANLPYFESKTEIDNLIPGLLDSSLRIKNMLEDLKNISRKEDGTNRESVRINGVIQFAFRLTQNMIKKSTQNFLMELGDNIPEFMGNSQHLSQVFVNLILNACDALPDNTRGISISTNYNPKTNDILVQVKDEGEGISQQNLDKIKDPFFTTRRNTGGMGLGLSISQKIIQDEHHGRIDFDSTLGKGTTVSVSLPTQPFKEKNNQ